MLVKLTTDSEPERFTPSPQEIEIGLPDSPPVEKSESNDVTENATLNSEVTKKDDDIDEDDFVRIDNSRYENSRFDFIKSVTSKYDVILSEDLDCDSPNDQSITIELPSQQQYHQNHHQHVNFSPEISPEPSPSPPQVSRFQQVESRFEFHEHFCANFTFNPALSNLVTNRHM